MEIDPQFVDVDFTKCPEYRFGAKEPSLFGFAMYEDTVPILSWTEIDEIIEEIAATSTGGENYVSRIFDQEQEGSCVANAFGQGFECASAKKFGTENVIEVSPISLYKKIGTSPQSGATVSDGIEQSQSHGFLPRDTARNKLLFGEHVMSDTGFYTPYPQGYQHTAKHFRVDEAYVVRSVQGIYSALARREFVIVGREGHSILYTTPIRNNSRRAAKYANSWNLRWGMPGGRHSGGFGVDTERQVEKSGRWAVAIRSVVDRPLYALGS